jgi:hypothetical protein
MRDALIKKGWLDVVQVGEATAVICPPSPQPPGPLSTSRKAGLVFVRNVFALTLTFKSRAFLPGRADSNQTLVGIFKADARAVRPAKFNRDVYEERGQHLRWSAVCITTFTSPAHRVKRGTL